MDLKDLEVFFKAAEAQSFLHSGVNLSPSAVGRKISQLEKNLDVKLFIRHQSSVSLTDEGFLFYERVKKILAEVEASKGDFDKEGEFTGKVIIHAPAGWNNSFLMKYCKAFLEKYPDANFEVYGNDVIPRFDVSTPQLGIYYSQPNSISLFSECISQYRLRLYATQEYIEKYGEPKTLEELDNHKLLAYNGVSFGDKKYFWHLEIGKSHGEKRQPFFCSDNLMPPLLEGMGIATISESNPAIQGFNLVNILPDIVGPEIEMYLIYHKLHQDNKSIRLFAETLKELI